MQFQRNEGGTFHLQKERTNSTWYEWDIRVGESSVMNLHRSRAVKRSASKDSYSQLIDGKADFGGGVHCFIVPVVSID